MTIKGLLLICILPFLRFRLLSGAQLASRPWFWLKSAKIENLANFGTGLCLVRGIGEISAKRAKYKWITILLSSFSASNIQNWFGIECANPQIPRFRVSPSKSLYKRPPGWHDRMGCRKSQDGSIGIGLSISDASMWYLNDSNPRKKFCPSSRNLLERSGI